MKLSNPNPSNKMAQLLSQAATLPKNIKRGDILKGEIIGKTDSELIIEIGGKSEGTLPKRDLRVEDFRQLKVGDSLEVVVLSTEDQGQIILTTTDNLSLNLSPAQQKKYQKFLTAYQQQNKLMGKVVDLNKGGLVVEVEGMRGFLPASQLGLSTLLVGDKNQAWEEADLNKLLDQTLPVSVIEVAPADNRLILSTRSQISQGDQEKLAQFKEGQTVRGQVRGIFSFGLMVEVGGLEGFIAPSETAWEKTADLTAIFHPGEEVEAQIISLDEKMGRLNLSLKRLKEDPFDKLAEEFQVDDVVRGVVLEITEVGMLINLTSSTGQVEGFVPAAKLEAGQTYQLNQEASFLIDSLDKNKRKIILAPFLTSTKGLIYK